VASVTTMERPDGIADAAERLITPLRVLLRSRAVRISSHQQVKADVHRVRTVNDGGERAYVLKRSTAEAARRNWLIAERWLPGAGLKELGPPLVAVAFDESGERAWQLYDDLSGHPLGNATPVQRREVELAVAAIARIHTALAEQPILRECRLWGGDRGIAFFSGNVRDATRALRAPGWPPDATRGALLERLSRLAAQEDERARTLAAVGGPETLVHGDLWNTNVMVVRDGASVSVRLIDWDEAAVAPFAFDVSTLLLRFEPSERAWILDAYRRAVGRLAGWRLPPDRELNSAFETAAYARLASLLVWTIAAADVDAPWLAAFLAQMARWLDDVAPVMPE
jgi:Ser/Thr protein kinase RdoA (MazF antagonist)